MWSNGQAPYAAVLPQSWRLTDREWVVYARGADKPAVVCVDALRALNAIHNSAELEQIDGVVQRALNVTPEQSRALLEQLAEAGCLVSLATLCLTKSTSFNDYPICKTLGIITADRPLLLERCLSSYASSVATSDTTAEIVVVDDGRRPSRPAAGTVSAGARGCAVHYLSPSGREQMALALSRMSGVPLGLVRFAICGQKDAMSVGSARNALTLLLAGVQHVQCDDDSVAQMFLSRDADTQTLLLSPDRDASSTQYCETVEEALSTCAHVTTEPLSAHAQVLGRSVGSLVSEFAPNVQVNGSLTSGSIGAARIRMTLTGVLGDCGAEFPYRRLCDPCWLTMHSDEYVRLIGARQIARSVPHLTITRFPSATGFSMGLDNRDVLPPFMPVGRGEDSFFAFIQRTIDPNAFAAFLPEMCLHSPEHRRGFSRASLCAGITRLRMCDLLRLVCAAADGTLPTSSGEALGRHVESVGTVRWRDFVRYLGPWYARAVASRVRTLNIFKESIKTSQCHRQDLDNQIAELRNALSQPFEHAVLGTTTASLASDGGVPERGKATLDYITQFGQLLQAWPGLWRAGGNLDRTEFLERL